jgi:hypothetical protein
LEILQLTYSSISTKRMLTPDLYSILRTSRRNNQKNKITGLLIYSGDTFLQYLEGPKTSVHILFEKISQDNRHSEVNVLAEEKCSTRIFPKWEMAYSAPTTRDLANWIGLRNTTSIDEILNKLEDNPVLVREALNLAPILDPLF